MNIKKNDNVTMCSNFIILLYRRNIVANTMKPELTW